MLSFTVFRKWAACFAAPFIFSLLTVSVLNAQSGPVVFVPREPRQVVFDGIYVVSNPDVMDEDLFISRTVAALELFKSKAPDHFSEFSSYVQRIEANKRAGVNLNLNVMTIGLIKQTVDASPAWLASYLARGTVHIKRFKQTGKRFGDAHLVADKKEALRVLVAEQIEANNFQLEVLTLLGGLKFETDFVKSQRGDEADIDRDGDYDSDDWAPQKPRSVVVEGITIETNSRYIPEDAFIEKVSAALRLMKAKAPAHFAMIKTYIGQIKATEASGANFNGDVMTIELAKRTFDASLAWVTSVLIHETIHIKKFKDTGKKFGDAHLMSDKKAALQVMINEELDCNRIQLEVLQLVGGTKREIDYLKAQKGDHFDIDKDGDFDFDDYKLRNWE